MDLSKIPFLRLLDLPKPEDVETPKFDVKDMGCTFRKCASADPSVALDAQKAMVEALVPSMISKIEKLTNMKHVNGNEVGVKDIASSVDMSFEHCRAMRWDVFGRMVDLFCKNIADKLKEEPTKTFTNLRVFVEDGTYNHGRFCFYGFCVV